MISIHKAKKMVNCEHNCHVCPDAHICPISLWQRKQEKRKRRIAKISVVKIAHFMGDDDVITFAENGKTKTAEAILNNRVYEVV